MNHLLIADRDVRYPTTPYGDRVISPAETVQRVTRHFAALGITRVARQTGLDRIGIPCFAAFRPNASTLSNSQGKGLDDDSARASAVMEAAEFAIAERASMPTEQATTAELRSRGIRVLDTRRLMPIGRGIPDDLELPFVRGVDLLSGAHVMVPHEAATIDMQGAKLETLNRSTNGLASGNTESEAVFHALCELIERDATALDRVRQQKSGPRLIDVRAITDVAVVTLIERVRDAGFDLWLIDQTSDLGIPCVEAIIGDPSYDYSRHFDLATGYGCHPIAERAIVRAITEAAQTRVTNIAGSRDDFVPEEYNLALHSAFLGGLATSRGPLAGVPQGASPGTPRIALLKFVLERLKARGVGDLTMVRVGGEEYGFSVVKVFAPDLEDKAANTNWRPGRRYLRAMMAS
jgi:ribosomal protein S12 methylthiotransferase accessory factor